MIPFLKKKIYLTRTEEDNLNFQKCFNLLQPKLDAKKIFIGNEAFKLRNAPLRDGPTEGLQQPAVLGGHAETILLDILEALTELIKALGAVKEVDIWVPGVINAATSVTELVEGIETRVRTDLNSKKVFIE